MADVAAIASVNSFALWQLRKTIEGHVLHHTIALASGAIRSALLTMTTVEV